MVVAKRIVDATTNTVLSDLKVGINLFFSFRNHRGTQPWKVPLTFGSKIEIPVCTVKLYTTDLPFNLSTEKQITNFILAEDESVSVDRADIVSGIERHGKFVKVDEKEMFKVECPRTFAVVGFTHKKNIPEYYMRGKQKSVLDKYYCFVIYCVFLSSIIEEIWPVIYA